MNTETNFEKRAGRRGGYRRSGMGPRMAFALLALALVACGGDDTSGSGAGGGAAGGGTGGSSGGNTGVGTLQVQARWEGTIPDGTELKVALFQCPFSMPPKRFFKAPVDKATGEATATDDEAPVGDWCVMAYYDMDPKDGLAPVPGLDPVNATGEENDKGAIPVTVAESKTTTISLQLKVGASK